MDVTDRDIENIRRISEQVFGDKEYLEIDEVKDTSGDVMVRVSAVDDDGLSLDTRNAFAGKRLRTYHDNGYVAVAVGGGNERHSAWFERADTIDFGESEPKDEYELDGNWDALVTDYITLKHKGETVIHIPRDGWTIDGHISYTAVPSRIINQLEDIGFVKSDGPLDD